MNTRSRWSWFALGLGIILLAGGLLFHFATPFSEMELRLDAKILPQQGLKLYYRSSDSGYVEEQSIYLNQGVIERNGVYSYTAFLPPGTRTAEVRIDPELLEGVLAVDSLSIRKGDKSADLSAQDLLGGASTLYSLEAVEAPGVKGFDQKEGRKFLKIESQDPHWIIPIPPEILANRSIVESRKLRWLGSAAVPVLGLLLIVLTQRARVQRAGNALLAVAEYLSRSISKGGALQLGPGAVLVLVSQLVIFVLSVGLKLHNSSIGIWYDKFGVSMHQPALEWGEAQEIRSDEWYVFTPWLLNQVNTGMRTDNPNIGPPGAPLVAGLPVLHPTMLAQPQFWGFMFLDNERGLAWQWGFRSASFFSSLFLFFIVLTRGKTLVSVAGALAIFGSSIVQWWFASWATEIISGMAISLVGVYLWINSKKPWQIYAGTLLAALAGMNIVLQPYLPYIVSLALLGVFISVVFAREGMLTGVLQSQTKHRIWAGIIGATLFASLFYAYYDTASGAIHGILNTEYPGKRRVLGGGVPVESYLSGFFEFWRDKYEYPLPPLNPSESSRFIYLFPMVALLALSLGRKVVYGSLFWALFAYCSIALIWMSAPMPDAVRSAMAALGFSYILPHRWLMGLGLASWIFTILAFSKIADQGGIKQSNVGKFVALSALSLLWAWSYLRPLNPEFYNLERLAVGVGVAGSILWAVARGNSIVLLTGVLLSVWYPLHVNPFSSGLSRLMDKQIFQLIGAMDSFHKEKWAVYGNTELAQLLRAKGHQVISGEYFVPPFDLLHVFDPNDQFRAIWNNYGSFELMPLTNSESVTFLQHTPNSYTMSVSPCNPKIRAAGVTRVIFQDEKVGGGFSCLQLEAAFSPIKVFVYAFKSPSAQ